MVAWMLWRTYMRLPFTLLNLWWLIKSGWNNLREFNLLYFNSLSLHRNSHFANLEHSLATSAICARAEKFHMLAFARSSPISCKLYYFMYAMTTTTTEMAMVEVTQSERERIIMTLSCVWYVSDLTVHITFWHTHVLYTYSYTQLQFSHTAETHTKCVGWILMMLIFEWIMII